MAKSTRCLNCCRYSLIKLVHKPRFIVAMLALLFYLQDVSGYFDAFLLAKGATLNFWGLYAFLSSDVIFVLITSLLLFFIFCDAPFYDQAQQYILLRGKRSAWTMGQVLYIMVGVFCFLIATALIEGVCASRYLEFGREWGKGLNTLAKTNAGGEYGVPLALFRVLVMRYSALEAFFLSFALRWMACVIGVLLMFLVNALCKWKLGFIAACLYALMDVTATEFFSRQYYIFSPVSLSRLAALTGEFDFYSPTFAQGVLTLAICLLALWAAAMLVIRKREINPWEFD